MGSPTDSQITPEKHQSDSQKSPPAYTESADPREDRLPPYKASHTFANSNEELAALKEFAREKEFIVPGTQGTYDFSKYIGEGGKWYRDSEFIITPTGEQEEWQRRKDAEKAAKQAERERKGSVSQRMLRAVSGSRKDKQREDDGSIIR